MKRPPTLQLFDAREEGKGPGTAYGRASEPARAIDTEPTSTLAPAPAVIASSDAATSTPKVID